jgi:hypothetical protein
MGQILGWIMKSNFIGFSKSWNPPSFCPILIKIYSKSRFYILLEIYSLESGSKSWILGESKSDPNGA